MPTIICNYCEYVGSGDSYDECIDDVLAHEETCSEKPDDEDEQPKTNNVLTTK